MHTFDIKMADDIALYIVWKIMNLSLEEAHPKFHDFLYDLPNTIKADDFAEQNNMTRSQFYLRYMRKIFELGLVKNLRIRVIKNINRGLGIYEADIVVEPTVLPNDILMKNRGSIHARFISGEFNQREAINISGMYEINDEYRTCFLFEPNYDYIAQYIHQYLLIWSAGKIPLPLNYILPKKQIDRFHDILLNKSDSYGDTFKYIIGDNKDLSEITLLLYFSYIRRDIEMENWDDNVKQANKLISIEPIVFYIKSKLKQEQKKVAEVKKSKIFFNEESGEFFNEGLRVGRIRHNTRAFYFFKYLYANFPNAVDHGEIVDYVKRESKSIDNKTEYKTSHSNYLADIKSNIDKNIRKYIDSPTGQYQLLDSPQS